MVAPIGLKEVYSGILDLFAFNSIERPSIKSNKYCVLKDYRGLNLWKEDKRKDTPMKEYFELEWMIFLMEGDILRIYDFKHQNILWSGKLVKDGLIGENYYHELNFIQKDVPFKQWANFFSKNYHAEIVLNKGTLKNRIGSMHVQNFIL